MNYSEHFDTFWTHYGQSEGLEASHKGPKREAFKAWEKACKRWLSEEGKGDEREFYGAVNHGYMLNSTNRKATLRAKQFCPRLPFLSTWLNQFRFEAELDTPTSELKALERAGRWLCSCGQPACGVSEAGNRVCSSCDLEIWKDARKSDPAYAKWHPAEMIRRWPKLAGETWHTWYVRVRNDIIKHAPSHSMFNWQPPESTEGGIH